MQAILYDAIRRYKGEENNRKVSIGYRMLKRIMNKEVVDYNKIEYIILKSKCNIKEHFHSKGILKSDKELEAASDYLIDWLKNTLLCLLHQKCSGMIKTNFGIRII